MSTDVVDRLTSVQARVRAAAGDGCEVTIVAVTKGFGVDEARAAIDAGIADLGENYAQELVDKAPAVPEARWHFLGAVQRNKVARLAPLVSTWQGVDRLGAGEEIARRAPGARVFVQVNVSGAAGRNGCAPGDAPALIDSLRQLDLDVAGLMAVASRDSEAARAEFEQAAGLRSTLGLRELSIGMSDDYEDAVAAGATMIRLGRALFGDRPSRKDPEAGRARARR